MDYNCKEIRLSLEYYKSKLSLNNCMKIENATRNYSISKMWLLLIMSDLFTKSKTENLFPGFRDSDLWIYNYYL